MIISKKWRRIRDTLWTPIFINLYCYFMSIIFFRKTRKRNKWRKNRKKNWKMKKGPMKYGNWKEVINLSTRKNVSWNISCFRYYPRTFFGLFIRIEGGVVLLKKFQLLQARQGKATLHLRMVHKRAEGDWATLSLPKNDFHEIFQNRFDIF